MKYYTRNFALAVVVLTAWAPPVFSEAVEHASASSVANVHDFDPNLLAVFVGVTYVDSIGNGLALGIDYERRLNRSYGVGVLVEYTFGDLDFWVYAVPFAYHIGPWKFFIAPGIADGDHGSESLTRLGGEYAFEFGGWEIAPQLNADFAGGEESLVLGITIGKGF